MYVVCACEHVCTFQMCVISQVQQQKRLQKAQENLMSEEEKKKRRKLQKVSLRINLKIGTSRAGRFLGILVIPWYGNKTVRVSSKFQ